MTRFLSRRTFVLALAVLLPLGILAGKTVQAGNPAATFIQSMGDQALTSLTVKGISAEEREKRVRALLRKNFDINTIGKFTLGTHWRTATQTQKDRFFQLFETMIVKTYSQRFADYSGENFKVGGTTDIGGDTMVASQIIQKNGEPIAVEWRVRNKSGSMKVIDVLVEGVSMGVTQRSDFAAVIQQGGGSVDALIASLEKHQGTGKK